MEESKDEVTDGVVVNMLQDKLEFEISKKDIDRIHRIRKPSPRKKRPIIVKFVRYNDRYNAHSNKKRLKDPGISITESLTAYIMGQLHKARDEHVSKRCGLMMVRIYSRNIIVTVHNYFMVIKSGKRHVELWKRIRILCVLYIFT